MNLYNALITLIFVKVGEVFEKRPVENSYFFVENLGRKGWKTPSQKWKKP
jgi:hypothetical protein